MTIIDRLKSEFGEAILASHAFRGDDTITIDVAKIRDVALHLRDNKAFGMNYLMDLTVVDYLGRDLRFEVVYHFFSSESFQRLRVKVAVPESAPSVPTIVGIFKSADWMEREAWEFYGVVFEGHPNLKHLLLYPEFVGFPLRKDYPKGGEQPRIELKPQQRALSEDLPAGTG